MASFALCMCLFESIKPDYFKVSAVGNVVRDGRIISFGEMGIPSFLYRFKIKEGAFGGDSEDVSGLAFLSVLDQTLLDIFFVPSNIGYPMFLSLADKNIVNRSFRDA